MARLLGQEYQGRGVFQKYWLHTGDNGDDHITVENVQDVEPIFESVKRQAQGPQGKDARLVAKIPETVITEVCKVHAKMWGVKPREVFAELMRAKTDRSQKIWRMLTQGRDYSKLQAKTYGT